MAAITITQKNLDTTVAGNGIVLLDWWASWCGPCRSFAPVFEAAAEANPDIVFGKVDTEAEQQLAAAGEFTPRKRGNRPREPPGNPRISK